MMDTTPRVNLNGSGVRTLLDDAEKIWTAIENSIKAMRQAYPHGRDWQTEKNTSIYPKAREQWEEQIKQLFIIQEFISHHVSEIYKQETDTRDHKTTY